jgi:Flp pilus assembly protein TadG
MLTALAHRLRVRGRDERGSTMVMFAVSLPLLLIVAAFVIDIANWFEDKRHLQIQADAAAFAGAQNYREACSDTFIRDGALAYAGDLNRNAAAYNPQISPTAAERQRVHALINSTDYWTSAGPNSDYTDGAPCTKKYIDVKMTHDAPSWFFGSITPNGVLGAITAHARVQINQVTEVTGSMPLAVPDVDPAAVAVMLIDEGDPNGMAQTPLAVKALTSNGDQALNGTTLAKWSNTVADPISLTIPAPVANGARNVGVVVALSGNTGWSLAGSVATVCGQVNVDCYIPDTAGTTWSGASYIRGYDPAAAGTLNAAIATDVKLFNHGCTDASGPYFLLMANGIDCTFGVWAKVSWGTPTPPSGAKVFITGFGCNGANGCPMTLDSDGYYKTDTPGPGAKLPLASAAAGAQAIDLQWETGSGPGKLTGVIQKASRAYAADDRSGPIQFLQVLESGVAPANSLTTGVVHDLQVVVGLAGAVKNSPTPVLLRLASGNGAQTQTLNCGGGTFQNQVQYGCPDPYQINAAPPTCHAVTPPDCVPQGPGNKTAIVGALNARFVTAGVCAPNNSGLITSGNSSQLDPNDKRIVPLIITSYGAFSNNPSNPVPVIRFATFYIAGWGNPNGTGASKTDPACAPPVNTPYPNPTLCTKKGQCGDTDIWGYFFKYIGQFGGSTGTTICDLSSLSPCVPVMTD